jgi:hypothetical protein
MNDGPDVIPARSSLLGFPGVVGVGYGLKETGGELTYERAWRVYVRDKRPWRRLTDSERIPTYLGGLRTDVIEHATAAPSAGKLLPRPQSGVKIANSRGVPGTLGCIGWTVVGEQAVLLSTWHVLFGNGGDEHGSVWMVEEVKGTRRFHEIGKTLHGKIGTLRSDGEEFYVDCAIASCPTAHRTAGGFGFLKWKRRTPQLNGNQPLVPGDRVRKTGSATQTTEGLVVDICYPDLAFIENRAYPAPRQVLVRSVRYPGAFSAEGDSGAAIVNQEEQVVGLLWGTNCRGEGVACHIAPVLHAMNMRLGPPPRMGLRQRLTRLCRRPEN